MVLVMIETEKVEKVKLYAVALRLLGRLITTILTVVLFAWLFYALTWLIENFKFEWVGVLILIFSAKTKILSFMFIEAYMLSDNTSAMRRVHTPELYGSWRFPWMDLQKLKFFIRYPYFMEKTDWKQEPYSYNLTNLFKHSLYVRKVWFVFLLQLCVGYIVTMGYLTEWRDELILLWAFSCFLGSVLSNLPFNKTTSRLWYHSKGFPNLPMVDVFYLLSLGFTRRGRPTPFRLIFSIMFVSLAVLNYLELLESITTEILERSEFIWQWLQGLFPQFDKGQM